MHTKHGRIVAAFLCLAATALPAQSSRDREREREIERRAERLGKTIEKTVETNQWATLTGTALNNQLNYRGSDKGNTFGVNAVIHLVPEKWTFSTSATHQKVNGLMDITAREAGSFYTPGRTTLIPAGTGGAQDITDYDDTKLTNVMVDLAYNANARTTLSLGYAYEKYDYADAFNAETSALPQSVLTYLKANDGPYKANVGYLRLSYRF